MLHLQRTMAPLLPLAIFFLAVYGGPQFVQGKTNSILRPKNAYILNVKCAMYVCSKGERCLSKCLNRFRTYFILGRSKSLTMFDAENG